MLCFQPLEGHAQFVNSRHPRGGQRVTADARAQVPMFSASGLRVQYLKVWEKSSYKVDKWVRKVCRSGDYNVRI